MKEQLCPKMLLPYRRRPRASQQLSERERPLAVVATQAPSSVAWPARPVLILATEVHGPWRLPSPGHQCPTAQAASMPLHDVVSPAAQCVPGPHVPGSQHTSVFHDSVNEPDP